MITITKMELASFYPVNTFINAATLDGKLGICVTKDLPSPKWTNRHLQGSSVLISKMDSLR